MDNQRLPTYPEHQEPTEAVASAEYDRETKPRTSPWVLVGLGLALFIGIFFAQKYLAQYFNEPIHVPPAAQGK